MKTQLANLWAGIHDTTILLTLVVWLCALPFVLLLSVPFFGWQVGLMVATITLIVALIICYAICYFPNIAPPEGDSKNAYRSRMR